MRSIISRISPILPVLIFPLLLAACGAPAPPADTEVSAGLASENTSTFRDTREAGDPVTGDYYVTNPEAEPAHLNPVVGNDGYRSLINLYIFDQILSIDNETKEFIPRIAKTWEESDDHLTYTFHLRDDVFFHDGVQLTANDILFTYDKIMDPKTDSAELRNYYEDVERVEIIDDFTVRFHMKKPYFRHIIVLGLFEVMPKHIYENDDINTHPNNRKPVGSGPYKFESWDTGQRITLVRNEDYWWKPVYMDKRVFKIVTDREASFQLLERQELDMMRVPPEKWVKQANTPEFKEKYHRLTPGSPSEGTLSRYNYVSWNMRKPQFKDKRVRQALTMLCDRQTILDQIYMGLGKVISGSFDPGEPEYDSSIAPWPFDPERAKKLLDEAGWIDRDRDGIREKDGVKLAFELSFTSQVSEYEQMSTVYQEELKRAGIKMTINPLEWATFLERVYKRSFDACMLSWVSPILSEPYQLWHSSQAPDGSNHSGFINAEADKIFEDARLEFDRDKRIEMYHRFHAILHDVQPYTFLYSRPGLLAVSKRFHDVRVYPMGTDSTEWWVPLEQQMYK